MYRWSLIKILAPWFLLFVFAACGTATGSNDYAGGGIGGTGVSVGKITAAGGTSVDVNGVAFDTTNATVTVDGVSGNQNNLKVGMIVKVDGTFNPDGTTGLAANIEFKDILEGTVDLVDPASNTIVVLGQTVIVDSTTSFDDFFDLNGNGAVDVTEFMNDVVAGNIVEVSGFVDTNGIIHASYISLKYETFEDDGSEIELKGIIANLDADAMTFTIGIQTIDYRNVTLEDTLDNGLYVEVKSSAGVIGNMLIASRIELEDNGYHFKDSDEFKVEGYVTALLTEGKFELAGQTVQVIAATQYEDGSIVDIADIKVNMKLEVEGTVDALGVLVADRIKVESGDNGSDDDSDHDSTDSHDDSDDDSDDVKGDHVPS